MASPPGRPPRGPGGGPRGPRRDDQRPPRREGGFQGPRRESGEGPRRESGFAGPRREGGVQGPRREGSPQGPRREGGFQGPRREAGAEGPRREGFRARTERPEGERREGFRPRTEPAEGERPYRPREAGERPFAPRGDGPRPYRPREGAEAERRPPRRFEDRGDRPPRPQDDRGPPRRPFRERPPREEPEPYATPRPAHSNAGHWLYGLHVVAAALANPARHLRRLLLTEEAAEALAEKLPKPWPLTPETTERGRLDQLLGRDVVHQGAALLADPLAVPALETVLARPGPVLVLDQVTDPRNIGAILRSAAAFGAAGVVVQDRHAPEETGALAKAASGALETLPLLRAVNLARTLVALKAAGLWTVGLAADGAEPLAGPALAERRVALVLGAEGEGLRRLTRETCDELVSLGHAGGMESLNVSAAAAIALYELARRA